jgi:hypothetical protein
MLKATKKIGIGGRRGVVATRNIRALSADRGVGDDIPQVEEALRRKVRARQKKADLP